MTKMTTWRKLLDDKLVEHGESWADVEACTLTEEELDVEFDSDFGAPNGKPFSLWTTNRVYFSDEYDGLDFVNTAFRNPPERA